MGAQSLYPVRDLNCLTSSCHSNPSDETLLPNTFTCARLRQLDREFAIKAARDWNKELEPLDAKLSKFIGGRPIRVVCNGTLAMSLTFRMVNQGCLESKILWVEGDDW